MKCIGSSELVQFIVLSGICTRDPKIIYCARQSATGCAYVVFIVYKENCVTCVGFWW